MDNELLLYQTTKNTVYNVLMHCNQNVITLMKHRSLVGGGGGCGGWGGGGGGVGVCGGGGVWGGGGGGGGGVYTGITLSVCLSVCPSVCRRHVFRSVTQVCFGISIWNFICMLLVAMGRSLLIFSDVTFKMAAWWPSWIFRFPDSNFCLALNIKSKLQ